MRFGLAALLLWSGCAASHGLEDAPETDPGAPVDVRSVDAPRDACRASTETCNDRDDDCDGSTDEESYRYDPWGARVSTSGIEQPFGFAGGIWLSGPDLWHLGARNLDPTLGRFTTSDPAGFEGGLNVYEYAGSDPVNVIDPTGLTPVGGALVGGIVCAMVLAVNGGDVATAAANILTNALGEAYFGARALARAAGSRSASALATSCRSTPRGSGGVRGL